MIKIKNILTRKNVLNFAKLHQLINKYNFSVFKGYNNDILCYRKNYYSRMNYSEKINNSKNSNEENVKGDIENSENLIKEDVIDKDNKTNQENSENIDNKKIKDDKQANIAQKIWWGFKNVWKQTFPTESDIEEIFEKRKEEAIKFKSELIDFTEEMIDEIEGHLPEWKRGAVECDFIIKYDQESTEMNEDSDEKFSIDVSSSTLLSGAKELLQKSNILTPTSKVVELITRRIPSFNLLEFEKEVNYIFRQVMDYYLNDDLEQLKKVASEQALALMTGEIKSRIDRKIELKFKELFHMEKALYFASAIKNNSTPVLRFRVQTQEINCLISKKDQLLVEGKESQIQNIQYIIELTPNPDPLVEELGHEWLIVGFERVGIFQQLV